MRRKTFDVLRFFVEHPGRLVSKADLLDAVWGNIAVGDTMPAICVGEIRKALGDSTKSPRFIASVPRRGYRFVANVTVQAALKPSGKSWALPTTASVTMVGRDRELAQLQSWYSRILAGEKRVVFVSGEPGIGKTTLVTKFLDSVAVDASVRIARGQCIEHYGAGEEYLPIFEALTRLAKQQDGRIVLEILSRFAPTWLAEMPMLSRGTKGMPPRRQAGTTQQRMLREITHALEELAAESPLVLFLEDLHWSDFSTLDLLSAMARSPEPAQLLIVGTYRPVDMLTEAHPLRNLKDDLAIHRQCDELQLKLLTVDDVKTYLTMHLRTAGSFDHLARALHKRTEGNPLFIINLVDYLLAQKMLNPGGNGTVATGLVDSTRMDVPPTIWQTIERNFERLTAEEQAVLEAASIIGTEFSAAAVAAALSRQIQEIETCSTRLARNQQFIEQQRIAEWPDHTVSTNYRFLHAFYQEVLYERTPLASRIQLHHRVAERLESAYGERATEVAAEIAHHYHRANHEHRAVKYFLLAGKRALRRFSNREAEGHFRSALRIISGSPPTLERDEQELQAAEGLRAALTALNGIGFSELTALLHRTEELCRRLRRNRELSKVLGAAALHHAYAGEMHHASKLAREAVAVAISINDAAQVALSRGILASTYQWMGVFSESRAQFEEALRCQPSPSGKHSDPDAFEQHVGVLVLLSRALWMLGFPDQARVRSRQCLELVSRQEDPLLVVKGLMFGADVHYDCGEVEIIEERTSAAVPLLSKMELEFPQLIGWTRMLEGWVLAQREQLQDALEVTRDGFNMILGSGQVVGMPLFSLLMAGVEARAGRAAEALQTVDRGIRIAEQTGHHHSDSELQRVRGEILLMCKEGTERDAETCFRRALQIARGQQAKSWELRAGLSLARLLTAHNRADEARETLAGIYNWFTEGFDTADLKEAEALLKELAK